MFRGRAGGRRWAGAAVMALLVAVVASGCGGSPVGSGRATGSAPLTKAAGTNVAANAWVGHVVSYDAVDPSTIGKVETDFALQADKGTLAFDQSNGAPENQYQPTGHIDWVAIPSQAPTLSEVARIETSYKPVAGSSVPASSDDTLALLQRKSSEAKWLITSWANLRDPSPSVINETRTAGNPVSSRKAARLPIPTDSLPSEFLNYIGGGNSSKFSPGPFTDQSRNQFDSTRAGWAATGVSFSYQYTLGSIQGAYTLEGGDTLVFLGLVFNNVFQANPDTCLQQSASRPQFPLAVPIGKYQNITLQNMASVVAIESPKSGTVSVIAESAYQPTKATTSPTTAPACL